MLMYNKNMGIHLEEEQKGFTIIEVMLFLALSGFLLMGILAGTGTSIANQRYKDAVQDAADALRSAYSFVADTQVETREKSEGACGGTTKDGIEGHGDDNSLRGRTSCAVYGAVVMIDGNRIQTTTVIGRDYYDYVRAAYDSSATKGLTDSEAKELDTILNTTSDIELLSALHANNLAYHCNPTKGCNTNDIRVPGGTKVRRLKWDTIFKAPRKTEEQFKSEDLKLTILIYRSPINGSVRTLSMDQAIEHEGKVVDYTGTFSNIESQGIYKYLQEDGIKKSPLTQGDIFLCVDSNGSESYAEHRRIIKITKNAHSQSGVILMDMDEEVYDSNGDKVLCDDVN